MTDNGNPFESNGNWWMWPLVVLVAAVVGPVSWLWRKVTGKKSA